MANARVSRVTPADAQEWLEALQQSGEGWWRQMALAVKADAHKALGMDRREFARQIGQRMIDPTEAIVELHREKHSKTEIADVLGISSSRVHNALLEAGLIEGLPQSTGGEDPLSLDREGKDGDEPLDIEGEAEEVTDDPEVLRQQIAEMGETMEAAIKGEQAKKKEAVKKIREELKKTQQALLDAHDDAKKKAEEELTAEDRERLRKEAEAWAEEQGQKVLAGLAHLGVQAIVADLEGVVEQLRLLIEEGGLDMAATDQIEAALAAVTEELNVAKATVGS